MTYGESLRHGRVLFVYDDLMLRADLDNSKYETRLFVTIYKIYSPNLD